VLNKAEDTLAVALGSNPNQPRLRSLQARIETTRGLVDAGAGKADLALAAARQAIAIAKKLAQEDPSYSYDLACARALQTRLDPAASGPPTDAVKDLCRAVEAGFDNVYKLETDERLAPIRAREDFRALMRLVSEKTTTPAGPGDAPGR
jgi:hypothetical protein